MEDAPSLGPRKTFAALAYPNYRLWFFGQMTSLFGTWMQSTAQGYLVFDITRSEAFLGYVGFAGGAASWIFTLYGGVIADRVPRRTLLIVTQSLSMLLAFALAVLTFTHTVSPWHIIGLAFLLGIVNAFDAPARQSFVLEMVERKVLTNAIALNSTMFNMATVVGPAIGGITYGLLGPGWCFTINGLSFIAVIGALAAMRFGPHPPAHRDRDRSALKDIRQGLRTVVGDRRILGLICLLCGVSLFGMSFATLLPAWAVQVLGGDALTNGYLTSARGAGALLSALFIASVAHAKAKGRYLTTASFVFPIAVFVFSFTRTLGLSLAVLVCVGAANIMVNNLANALVQTLTPDEVRGRVMSIWTLSFFGFMPLGALMAGSLAQAAGAPTAIMVGAAGMFACSVALRLLVPELRKLQ